MTTNEIEQQSIFEAHPALGKYISHHPSNRLRLLVRGAIFYTIPVLVLQVLFWNVTTQTAQRFLPVVFAAIALAVFWYIAHLWNREVVLYEQGFTYQEGSRIGHFRYSEIMRVEQTIQRLVFFGRIQRTLYEYTLISDHDERLHITNLYSDIEALVKRLERAIARDRLPLVQSQVTLGQNVSMGGGLMLSQNGIEFDGRELFWHELGARRVQGGKLILESKDGEPWVTIPVAELDNPVLLLAALKHYATSETPSTEARTSPRTAAEANPLPDAPGQEQDSGAQLTTNQSPTVGGHE